MCEISVVMPVYNAEMHIKDAIESVLEQSFVDFEFILIDDGSTDRTSSIFSHIMIKEYVLFRTVIIL